MLANRAKDIETGRAIYQMVDWYKEYASKFGAVLNNNPSPGNIAGGLAEHYDQVSWRDFEGRHHPN